MLPNPAKSSYIHDMSREMLVSNVPAMRAPRQPKKPVITELEQRRRLQHVQAVANDVQSTKTTIRIDLTIDLCVYSSWLYVVTFVFVLSKRDTHSSVI